MDVLIAPSEPPLLRAMGAYSPMVEACGVDVLWSAQRRMYGIQRKEIDDFFNSLDGRIQQELSKAKVLDVSILLFEGQWQWTRDGNLVRKWGRPWTKKQFWAYQASVMADGHWVAFTNSIEETVSYVESVYAWSHKTRHSSLAQGPSVRGEWGSAPTAADRYRMALQVLCPGIGVEMGRRVLEANDGRVPWGKDAEWFEDIQGIGKKRAKVLAEALS